MPPSLRPLFLTKEGRIVIGQPPNGPVLVATGLSVLAFLARHTIHGAPALWLSRAAALAWIYWSALEVTTGVNPFRRLLGTVVLLLSLYGLFRG